MSRFLLALIFLAGTGAHTLAQSSRPMVPEDYYRVVSVSHPQLSPDGNLVAFVRSTVSDDRSSRESSIWIVKSDGSEAPRRFTNGKSDTSPRWSPDGRQLAFLARREKKTHVHIMPIDGGEALAVTEIDTAVSSFAWSPDGRRLLLSMRTASDTTAAFPARRRRSPDVTLVRNTKYKRNGSGILDNKRSHLWLFDLEGNKTVQLTTGDEWNDANGQWSPHGDWIVFDSDRSGSEYEGGDNDDIWLVSADGSELKQITTHGHRDAQPVWSPDGEAIVYTRQEDPLAQPDLFLFELEKGEHRRLTGTFDRRPSGVRWSPDSETLFFTASDHGVRRAFRLDLADGTVARLFELDMSVSGLQVSSNGTRLAFTLDDATRPAEVWISDASGNGLRQLTFFNTDLIDTLQLQTLEEISFVSPEGHELQGFFLRPVGWSESETVPFVLNIKGGPGGMWGYQWFHEFQMLAGAGYAVGFVNYRGSTGYGFDHQKAVRLDYGGVDYRDNMAFVDEILKRYAWIDPDRLLVTGGSHGGFLTNWIITQTDRFKTAVTQRSVSNWISEAGQQEYTPAQMQREFGGSIWEKYELYWDRSPLKHARRVNTPTLIIHSDGDRICPLGQAEEWFYALKQRGIATELVIFHGENHSLSRTGKPINLVERLKLMLDWFQRYG